MAWITPIVSWLANNIPTKDDFNRIEGNILHLNNNKVEKVVGKDLSTNDYTTTEKNKLEVIEAGARKSMPASEILTALKTVDGVGSGLDADTLDGNDSSSFAAANHGHNGYAPTLHASAGATYGLGTTANYGHVKTINNLTQASHVDGTALSANQGKVLKDLLDTKVVVGGMFSADKVATTKTINLGFTPSFVMVYRVENNSSETYHMLGMATQGIPYPIYQYELSIVANGFTVSGGFAKDGNAAPRAYVAIK